MVHNGFSKVEIIKNTFQRLSDRPILYRIRIAKRNIKISISQRKRLEGKL
jgi:hypothetical protein